MYVSFLLLRRSHALSSLSLPSVINVLHVYHLLYFDLKPDDKFHHFLFIPLIGFPAQYWRWGCHRNFMCFFISGLPGGLDYFNLALVKQGLMSKMRQRKICANLNQWCRGPGILIASFLQFQSFLYGTSSAPSIPLLLTATLATYNALLYLGSSIRSHERALATEKQDDDAQGTKDSNGDSVSDVKSLGGKKADPQERPMSPDVKRADAFPVNH